MSQYERMVKGLIYNPDDPEIKAEQNPLMDRLYEFNQLKPSQTKEKEQYMKETFAECGENCYIELPFYANWGGKHLHLGNYVYANFGLTLVDDAHIYVGDHVMFAPNVMIATANHPLNPDLRRRGLQYAKDVHIGENTWIGAGAQIMPGVSIGKNCVIGAGSIVTKDIPDDSLAFGNPCRVVRSIGEHDREYYYKNEKIDWENLEE